MELVDITGKVIDEVKRSKIDKGIAVVYTPHTTAGITINENADPSVRTDLTKFIQDRYPQQNYFNHMEGNSPSHILSSMFGASESFIIEDGRLLLGTWQGIYFCEFDGPRQRKVYIKVIEDK